MAEPAREVRADRATWLTELGQHRWRGALAVFLLCLAIYVPGVLRLPAVDRTEIVYAETTRDMVARSTWLDPRYGNTVHQFRPIGTYWVQGIMASIAGPEFARTIAVYRAPGVIAVTLAVAALFWLAAPLVGGPVAFMAAALFAVAPLTVLVSQLAITEGLSLLPAIVAMLCLLRLYTLRDDDPSPTWLAMLFWSSVGFGMLLNALLVPILIIATLVALAVMDRDLSWLTRTRPIIGVPLALAIASPWIVVRMMQDGVPFSGLGVSAILEALGGSQDMKLRAFPGTFVLALLLGFLPGTALLIPALSKLWSGRDQRIARFLLAWVIGYLAYLELLSSKPGTYTVQVMFPALALAVAMLVQGADGAPKLPKWHAIPWPPIAAVFVLMLFVGLFAATGARPGLPAIVMIAVVATLFYVSAVDGRANRLGLWWRDSVAALALFAVTLLAVVLPSLDTIWPARQIARAIATACPGATGVSTGVLGFREPSGVFILGSSRALQTPEAIARSRPPLRIVEARWLDRYSQAMQASGASPGIELGCVSTTNVMRGCGLTFRIFGDGLDGRCAPLAHAAACAPISSLRVKSDQACD